MFNIYWLPVFGRENKHHFRSRHERCPGTHAYRPTGRYPSKLQNLGYRWVPGTEKIPEVGFRWVLGTEEILEVRYHWVPDTGQISIHAHACTSHQLGLEFKH